ncbi:MAG: sigma-70 family RNA polymerase sigma factor [Planctomycetaceae bacterium]|nr:sigma-70 family RNA polymerase sigma factor [Planctomycetaceae bacterium]
MPDGPSSSFRTTRWTQVVAARGSTPEAKQALRELCETYYGPVELFVRRYRDGTDDARDLTHEFFAKLLEGDSLGNADRTRGRFRSYLLGAVKHFLSDQQDRDQTVKRGGGHTPQSLDQPLRENDSGNAESLTFADPRGLPPDAYFDRQWALAVVEQAIDTLRAEAESIGELARFEVLQRWLVTPSSHDTAIEAARSLNLSDGAFKVAVHRLRKRFRHVVVDRIATTVDDPVEVQDELNYLINAMTLPMPSSS